MGSAQKMLDIKEEDKDNKEISSVKADIHGRDRNYKILNRNLQRDRKALIKFKLKMEKEIESIKSELSYKEGGSTKLKIEESFEKAILSDLGKILELYYINFYKAYFPERLDEEYRSLQISFHGYNTKMQVLERSCQDETQKIWDNINELQELTNITTRNIEDIYDKDILRLQNFQTVFEGDLHKLKNDIKGKIVKMHPFKIYKNILCRGS